MKTTLCVPAFMLLLAAGTLKAQAPVPTPGPTPVVAAAVPPAPTTDSSEPVSAKPRMSVQSAVATESLHIRVGESVILRGASAMKRVYVGNPAIVQTFTSAPEEIVVTAKAVGVTSLVLWETSGQSRLYTVSVDLDPAGLRHSIDEAYPNNLVQVAASQDRLMLSGTVPSPEVSESVVKLASSYTKDIVNSLRVVPVHGKQVQLKLRIAEADRSKLEQFGVNLFRTIGNNVGGLSTGQFASTTTATPATATTAASVVTSNPLTLFLYNFGHSAGATIQDLESKQVLQILAEPTLTTMSGQAARFLSGGEFPFPVPQGGTGNNPAITIQFKPYGVKVDFTPTVNADGSIHLKISPEVSTLDYTNAVTISGFTVPALSTRRAETEVELKDGQSFMLSGLLDRRITDNLSKIPGIASIPILGQLFRSKNNNHATTELIIAVTVTVVDPLTDPAAAPADPKWTVPQMDTGKFDQKFNKELTIIR